MSDQKFHKLRQAYRATVAEWAALCNVPAPYQFDPAFPPDHFVSQVTAHISAQTDAPCEYGEAGALTLLTAVTPRIKARLSPYPKGLGTNLYVLGIGRSTVSRKSTSKNHAKALHEDSAAAPSILPDKMSPEALEEQMAKRDGDAATCYVDEFGEMLRKLHHSQYMVDFQGDLLQLYDGLPLVKERHSKRNKQTGEQEQDRDRAQRLNLSVFGMTTPLLFHKLHLDDSESGLLARFAIVYPLTKPTRRALFESGEADVERARTLSAWLDRIHAWNRAGAIVTFTPEAMAAVDAFDAEQEQRQAARADDDVAALMYERHTPMLVKVAMLAAAGRPGSLPYRKLVVTLADVECALTVLRRWEGFTATFVKSLSATEQERLIQRCADMVRKRGAVPRKMVARDIHIPKRQLDEIEATLIDRGTITAKEEDGIKVWRWTGGNG